MNKIRIYFIPKNYKDIICDSVIIDGKNHTAKIVGGKENGKIYSLCGGARVVKEHIEVEE